MVLMFLIAIVNKMHLFLFTKLPWPGECEETVWSSSQTAACVSQSVKALRCSLYCWTLRTKAVNSNYSSIWLDRTGNCIETTISVPNPLFTRSRDTLSCKSVVFSRQIGRFKKSRSGNIVGISSTSKTSEVLKCL